MLSLFKKKPQPEEPLTLKTRVELFWKWYAEVAPRFYETIEKGKCAELATEVSARVDALLPGFAWVFGPGENKKGHSFTLSGEGALHRQLLAIYWLSRAPKLEGWTFHASRQPGSIENARINIGQKVFNPIEFWLTPSINRENEKVDITVWHPLFDILKEKDRWTILFLFLDEALGEYGTQQSIGEIKLDSARLADSMPLTELLGFVKKVEAEAGWKKYPPGQGGVVYKKSEPHDEFIRGDIWVGSTVNLRIVNEYAQSKGDLQDPLAGTGADYVFVSFDASILPKGKEATARGAFEDALREALASEFSGQVLGGALGTKNAYIDLMLFDGKKSLEIVQRVLKEKQLPAGTEIHFFAKEKRGHRIVL
jgi:hypothetical protein